MKLSGLDRMSTRLSYLGGASQQDRMILGKKRSLDRALFYSYQAAKVSKIGDSASHRALINPNQLKQNYDDKIISINFDSGFSIGTVFKWENTNTYWIIYLQDLTELAYFRGDVRRCTHSISWIDDSGEKQTSYVALIGPQEKGITSITKQGINMDIPNYTLQMLIPKTDATLKYFNRYSKFYLSNLESNNPAKRICWRVEAIDSISSNGILEVYASEYYANEDEDDVENGIVGGLIVEPIVPEPDSSKILGENFIKPMLEYEYIYAGEDVGEWKVISKNPVESIIDGKKIKIVWAKTYSGDFTLKYGNELKQIKVDSLF